VDGVVASRAEGALWVEVLGSLREMPVLLWLSASRAGGGEVAILEGGCDEVLAGVVMVVGEEEESAEGKEEE
jgi:hypothetical protein